MKRPIYKQIYNLLKKSHESLVSINPSTITNAGHGAFSRKRISSELPRVVCLYPGIYTPPIPNYALRHTEYLANVIPPSFYTHRLQMDENAYVLNLQSSGGYIDGCALESQFNKTTKLDTNPSACGHLVNHDAVHYNTEVFDFCWSDIMGFQNGSGEEDDLYILPNEIRTDGSPWYYDKIHEDIVRFPKQSIETSGIKSHGAALLVTKPLDEGDELLLDYKLSEPYPKWAEEWYNRS